MKNPTYIPAVESFQGLTGLGADSGDNYFDSVPYDDTLPRPLPCRSSDATHYIAPKADGSQHMLPDGAVLPILHDDGTWNAPSSMLVDQVKQLIFNTTNIAAIEKPEWARLRHFLSFFKDDDLPRKTPTKDTDFGWLQRHFDYYAGGSPKRGWYDEVCFRTQANGLNNWHYNQLWWHGMNFILTADPVEREKMWPYLLEQLVAHCAYGRVWYGPKRGGSRDEKGHMTVGSTNRMPPSKFYVLNLIMGWLLTDRHPFFEEMIRAEAQYWKDLPLDKTWKGFWGSREGTRNLSNAAYVAICIPDLAADMDLECAAMLNQYKFQLDRTNWVWPNLGNGGAAEESPWMQLQVVADICRVWELRPNLKGIGPSHSELTTVVDTILSDYGSEQYGEFRCVRYRYHTVQTKAFFLSNSAWLLPALRLLQHPLYEHQSRLFQKYAGCYLHHVASGTPRDINTIGARDATNGSAWVKNILTELEAIR